MSAAAPRSNGRGAAASHASSPTPASRLGKFTQPLRGASRLEARLWIAQRISAAVLALCVVVHLVTIIVAVRGGLSAADILGRLRSSTAWLVFYATFVLSVAVHAPIGLRAIVAEWFGWRSRMLDAATFLAGALLLALGARAIAGLFFGGAA